MKKILPNFLIVGVARCGTTSLFHYLKQHPKIGLPTKKEPKYFSSLHLQFPQKGIGDATVDEKIIKNFERYTDLFKGLRDYPLIGEASSDYFYYYKKTIPEIKKVLGDIPIIISIRNPIDRSYSAFNNLVRDGREALSFREALEKEEERIQESWDWMWAYKKGSLYADGIKAFQNNFSKVKVVLFEELRNDPIKLLHKIEGFLGVSAYNYYDISVKYSPSGTPKNKLIKFLSSRNSKVLNHLRTTAMSLVPRRYLENIAEDFFTKDKMENELREEMYDFFFGDIVESQKLINEPLPFQTSR